ncbi:MAG: macro domain-containing protein [Lachnospiraceae bacterium]|nr:macro domain-containing protein [Lachnospiraceae bacterium]
MAFTIIRNDITKVAADAIVNTANPKPIYAGGTDAAIYKAAGEKKLIVERERIGDIPVGEARYTPAFDLSAKYIIHTVGPSWDGGDKGEFELLRKCYEKSLVLAKELGCESIAFPLIATGVYGFPKGEALKIAISVFSEFLLDSDMKIILVVFDREAFVLSGNIFSGVDSFIDEKTASARLKEEYDHSNDILIESTRESSVRDRKSRPRLRNIFSSNSKKSESSFVQYDEESEEGGSPDMAFGAALGASAFKEAPMASMNMAFPMAGAKKSSLDDRVKQVADTWQESLFHMIDERGYTDTEVYKRANVDRKLFSKIRSNTSYQPKKITAVAFALALKLNLDETRDMLRRAGYALSPASVFDLIIEYFIEQGVYDTYTINLALFEHDQPLIGE